ncbi:MAG TPA: YabP/YqfC family sporulation protein [Clostridia bacterium]
MDFMSEISKVIDLPADIIMRYRYTVFGGRAVYVAGQRGLKVFNSEMVELKLDKEILKVTGEDLIIKHLSNNDCVIIGKINSVDIIK